MRVLWLALLFGCSQATTGLSHDGSVGGDASVSSDASVRRDSGVPPATIESLLLELQFPDEASRIDTVQVRRRVVEPFVQGSGRPRLVLPCNFVGAFGPTHQGSLAPGDVPNIIEENERAFPLAEPWSIDLPPLGFSADNPCRRTS